MFLLTRTFANITDFYSRNGKNYGLNTQSYHSGSPLELKKVKSPPWYWFHTSTTWWSASALMCRPVMVTKMNSNFPRKLIVFLLLFKDLLYILRLFVLLSNICFSFLPTWIVTDKINVLFSINSTMATVIHRSFFYFSWSSYISCSLIIWIRIVYHPMNTELMNTLYKNATSVLRWTAILQ